MTFGVDADRLSRSRFVLSRLVELSNGLEVLIHPDRAPAARSWVMRTRRRLDPSGVAVLFALVDHGSWYVPDFLVPVPGRYEPSLEEELAAVAAMPTELARFQLEMAFRIGPPPPAALERSCASPGRDPRWPLPVPVRDVLAAGGEAALTACVAEQLRRCWTAALAESWPGLRRVLDDDVRHRAARASRVGFAEIVGDLHRKLCWDGARVTLELAYDVSVDADPGLVLSPSVFLPRPAVWLGSPGQVMVGYPARGRGQLWSRPAPTADEAHVIGVRRAALLADLDTPRSTTELATRHHLSPATVSYHLGRLRQAGLVARRQAGHNVLYERTHRAVDLLDALSQPAT
ncbi:MAG TPA: helix-turn-helix domain-containing protein [Acidimicrobiales bacterium]|nr:helix-turn-helix domain-containing protein [Acidimicrobiales bacterium]